MNKNKLKKKLKKILQILICIYLIGLLGYQFYAHKSAKIHIIGYENAALIETNNQNFIIGDQNKVENISLENVDNFFESEAQEIDILSKNSGIFSYEGKSIFVFGSKFSKAEIQEIIIKPVSLETDFWIITNSNFPFGKMGPHPNEGILYIGSKNPGKHLRTFAQINKIPLISYFKTKGFRTTLNSKNSWEIYTEK